jgi:hypothetical protein
MTQPIPDPVYVILCDEEGGGQIVVDLDAFVRYGAQLDASLADLEAKWAICASRAERRPKLRRTDESHGIDPHCRR